MLAILFLAIVIFMVSSLIKSEPDTKKIHDLIRQTHKYSGLDQTAYTDFYANIKLALVNLDQEDVSKKSLHRALSNLDEIGLSTVSGDTEVQKEINKINVQLEAYFNELYIRERIKSINE